MFPKATSPKEALQLLKAAAKKAREIFEGAEHTSDVDYRAAVIIRKLENMIRGCAERLEDVEGGLRKAIADLRGAGDDAAAVGDAARALSEQLKTEEAAVRNVAEGMREEASAKVADAEIKRLEGRWKRLKGAQANAPGQQAAGGAPATGAAGGAANAEMMDAEAELKVAEVTNRIAAELRNAGGLKIADALSHVAAQLKDAADSADSAAAKGLPGGASPAETARRVSEQAAAAAETALAALRRAAETVQGRLKWPTYEVWKIAEAKVCEQSKIVDENFALIEAEAQRAATPAATEMLREASAYKYETDEIRNNARNSHEDAVVTEVLLKVLGFFIDQKAQIYERLEECDEVAKGAPPSHADMLFFAESLPVITGIIHVGSKRKELIDATDWVRKHWSSSDAHPRIVLSAMLFRYVTDKGADEAFKSPTPQPPAKSATAQEQEEWRRKHEAWKRKHEVWGRIRARVARMGT